MAQTVDEIPNVVSLADLGEQIQQLVEQVRARYDQKVWMLVD
jgi:hypothetical protein